MLQRSKRQDNNSSGACVNIPQDNAALSIQCGPQHYDSKIWDGKTTCGQKCVVWLSDQKMEAIVPAWPRRFDKGTPSLRSQGKMGGLCKVVARPVCVLVHICFEVGGDDSLHWNNSRVVARGHFVIGDHWWVDKTSVEADCKNVPAFLRWTMGIDDVDAIGAREY